MTTEPLVRLDNATVHGTHTNGVFAFKNIPYAQAERFGLPTRVTLSGDHDARSYGPTVPQASARFPGVNLEAIVGPGWVRGTDYLTANVWTPTLSNDNLPVMVFVHGGSFTAGSGSTAGYDGTAFARDGVVLVTINYRLGVLGFASLPGKPENRGLRDQLTALEWTRDNATTFGGNPDNITLFGESAGAISVCDLLATAPPGLFRRAISQSGGGSHLLTPAQAAVTTKAVTDALGTPISHVDDQALVDALTQVASHRPDLAINGQQDPLMGLSPIGPVLDGDLFHEQPVDAVAAGAAAGVDVLIGHNSDEMNLYLVGLADLMPPITQEILDFSVTRLHPDPTRVIDAYRSAGRGTTPGELLSAIGTDYMFAIPTARMADAHAPHPAGTWRYEFTWPSPAFDGRLGACHGIELPFVFDALDRVDFGILGITTTTENHTLATEIHNAWTTFAHNGNPGWPNYTPDHRAVRLIGTNSTTTTEPDGKERTVWEGIR